jgi:hypothetical protein
MVDWERGQRQPTLDQVVFRLDLSDPALDEPAPTWARRQQPQLDPADPGRPRIRIALRRR